MKIRLTVGEACELHNNAQIMAEAPAFEHIWKHLESARRRLQGAIERTGIARRVERGWKAKGKDFERSLEVTIPSEEVMALWAGLLFFEEKAGDVIGPLTCSATKKIGQKMHEFDSNHRALARKVSDVLRGVSI